MSEPMTAARRAEIEAVAPGRTATRLGGMALDLLTELRRVEGLLAARDAAWRRALWCTVIDLHAEANVASRAGQYDRLKKIARALAAKEPTP